MSVTNLKEKKILAQIKELEVQMEQIIGLLVPMDRSKRLCEALQNVLGERFILAQNEHDCLKESLEFMRKDEKTS